jgi:hypothetical protein
MTGDKKGGAAIMAFEGNARNMSPSAGKPAEPSMLVNVPKLVTVIDLVAANLGKNSTKCARVSNG